MLEQEKAVLVIIDVQTKLLAAMHEKEALIENLKKLIRGAKAFGLPIIQLEQNPNGLGPTVPEIAELLADVVKPIPKFSFSCCGNEEFMAALKATGRRQVMLTGIEAHVCVHQTAADLARLGYEVHVVADAVSSRKPAEKQIALERIEIHGCFPTCVEMALFEILKAAKGDIFKEISRIVK
ncbi:MAG: hydrolase [Dehalococcoidia bacterium]|nr:hydrolase [Dehalococcoidia bacterium]